MARIRTIKPEFWTSTQVTECSPTARLLFIGLWNFSDDHGVHPTDPMRAKMEVFPGDSFTVDQVSAWIGELISHGLLTEYVISGQKYWIITGWKHQKIDKPSYKYPLPLGEDSPKVLRVVGEDLPAEGKGMEGNGEKKGASAPLTFWDVGESLAIARTTIGRMVKDYGEESVSDAIRNLSLRNKKPADATQYVWGMLKKMRPDPCEGAI